MPKGVSRACRLMLSADEEKCYVQEVAQILSDALPEYKFKVHKEEEKKQYCDNSKVTYADPVLAASSTCSSASVRSSTCRSAICSTYRLDIVQDGGQTLPVIRISVDSFVIQTIQELGMTLTPPEVFVPAMMRCMIRLGLAKPVEQ